MYSIQYTDYFRIAHNETRNSVPNTVSSFFLGFFGNRIKRIGQYLIHKIGARTLKKFGVLNLELKGIHAKLLQGELSTENLEEDYLTMKKIIKLLTTADELFADVNYFDISQLEKEIKETLHTTYLIEIELKGLIFNQKKTSFIKDEIFHALSEKSNSSLSKSI